VCATSTVTATEKPPQSPPPRLRLAARFVRTVAWFYFVAVLVTAGVLYAASDSNWQMTLLTFAPRWVVLLPAVGLLPLALLLHRRSLWPVLLAVACGGGPIMGFCLPWRSWLESEPKEGQRLRVVTINIGQLSDRVELMKYLRDLKADVVAIQEWSDSAKAPLDLGPDWHTVQKVEKLVASRFRITKSVLSEQLEGRWYSPCLRCDIETPAGPVQIYCVHLYTLRKGFEAMRAAKLKGVPEMERTIAIRNGESELIQRFAGQADQPAIVLGDFNMTNDSVIFQRDWGSRRDAFSVAGLGWGYTFHSRKIGLRIDHILTEPDRWTIRSCEVGPDFHGQHRPLIADLLLRPGPK
jgi:endonuclease/exonuclease/phosphatase family metal-dependent hydrolase